MKKYIIPFILIVASFSSFAQETKDKKEGLKRIDQGRSENLAKIINEAVLSSLEGLSSLNALGDIDFDFGDFDFDIPRIDIDIPRIDIDIPEFDFDFNFDDLNIEFKNLKKEFEEMKKGLHKIKDEKDDN